MANLHYQGNLSPVMNSGRYVRSQPTTTWPNFISARPFQGGTIIGIPAWGTWYFNSGVVGVLYNEAFDMPNVAPVTYSLLSGSLPTGLALVAVSGNEAKITGTPTAAGTYSFTLRATNSNGIADQLFSITIIAAGGGSYLFVS